MANGEIPQSIQAISKNLYIPISLVVGIIAIAMFIGTVNSQVQQDGKDIIRLEASVIPRPELEGRLKNIESDVSEIKTDVKSILKQGR